MNNKKIADRLYTPEQNTKIYFCKILITNTITNSNKKNEKEIKSVY